VNTMKTAIAILVAFMVLLPATLAQEEYTVKLSATPPECATALIGSGSYRKGSQATIEVRVPFDCRFVEWRLKGGGLPETVSANPFTFYVFGDIEAEAILQKLYRDNGTVVERFYVAFASNITSKAYTPPRPRIVISGEEVNIYTPQEVLDGDYRYVFLYWSGPEGLRIDTPSATIKVNRSMTLVANYYTFKKFLDEYYPIHIFVKPSYPDVELSDGRIERAVALIVKGYNVTIPIQPVPEPLIKLVEPVYETYIPYIVAVNSPYPVDITLNGQKFTVGSSVKLLGREGSTISLEAPSRYGRLKLDRYEVGGRPRVGSGGKSELIVAQLTNPISILITYTEIPYAFLIDVPLVGGLAYSLTETGYIILSIFFRDLDTIPYPIAMALPLALMAAPGAGITYAVSKASKGGVRGSLRISVRRGAYRRLAALVEERNQAPIIETFQNIPSDSRFQAPAEISERLMRAESMMHAETTETVIQEGIVPEEELPLDDVKELESCVAEGRVGRFRSSLLQLTEVGEELFAAIQAGRVRLEKDGTPLVYSAEVARLAERVSAMPSGLITVSGGERLLRERVVEAALAKAGRRWVRAPQNLILPPDVNTTVSMLKKLAKGADVVVVDGPVSKALAQAAFQAKLLVISLSDKGGDIVLPPLSDRLLPGIMAWLLFERDVLRRLDYKTFMELVRVAKCFRGLDTVSAYAEMLDEGLSPEEAVEQLWSREFMAVFPGFESKIAVRIVESGLSYGEARDLYITSYRQVMAGGDPQASWRRFVGKLEKLGVRVSNAG
jgi:hypothetical protein